MPSKLLAGWENQHPKAYQLAPSVVIVFFTAFIPPGNAILTSHIS